MRRAERLFRLVAALRAGAGLRRAADLAAALEVSPRTVYRDIAHLQASGLPIDGAPGVGYLLRPGFDLPPVTFTRDQIDALAVALAYAEALDDPALAEAARQARAKLQAVLPDPGAGALTGAPFLATRRATGAPQHAARLRQAVRERRVVWIAYADGAGRRSARRLQPLALWSFPAGWMVTGWCEARGGLRTFRLDRIATLTLTEGRFPDDGGQRLRAFLAAETCRA